jgi:hypothetical protein
VNISAFVVALPRRFNRFAFLGFFLTPLLCTGRLEAQENSLFAGLPYDETLLRAKLDQYARASDTAEPPLNIDYHRARSGMI